MDRVGIGDGLGRVEIGNSARELQGIAGKLRKRTKRHKTGLLKH